MAPQMTRLEYATQCAARMGVIPPFDCTTPPAKEIPIKVNATPQPRSVTNNRCDDPPYNGPEKLDRKNEKKSPIIAR